MPTAGQSALKFLRSNLRRGAKPKVRIAVLGQASTGKTALIVRYITRRFIVDYAPELAKIYTHQTMLDQQEVNMEIWDTAGQFQSDAELCHLEVFVRWADAIVLIYSVTDLASFNTAIQLMEQIATYRPKPENRGKPNSEFCENCPNFPIILVGTKNDLWRDRRIRMETGYNVSQEYGCVNFREISTKDSLDQARMVFEDALRRGWLYRQHRELTKHRTLSVSSERNSIEDSPVDPTSCPDRSPSGLFPPGLTLPTASPSAPDSATNSPQSTVASFTLTPKHKAEPVELQRTPAKHAPPLGATKHLSMLSSIKKCISPVSRPTFHSLPQSFFFGRGTLRHRTKSINEADQLPEEEVEEESAPQFRSRSFTDSKINWRMNRSPSTSAVAGMQGLTSNASAPVMDPKDRRRKASVFQPYL